jgi:asparagine synthase (glutamine-hydrolysing)
MCGIAGILRLHPPGAAPPPAELAIPESWLDILDESIKHRGPDGQGRFRDRAVRADGSVVDVALVHRRLSIIDHRDGHQPMVSRCGPATSQGTPTVREGPETDSRASNLVAVVFNGCIYNHRELRRELTAAGHQFVTDHSDTEVLIHGWREWGHNVRDRFEGMYAAAVWDRAAAEVTLVRDRFGEKPLYYMRVAGPPATVAWSSTYSGLLRLHRVIHHARPETSSHMLHGWIEFGWNQMPPHEGLHELIQGEAYDCADDGQTNEARFTGSYWLDVLRPRSDALRAEDVDRMLRQAVHDRLEADVPLGCFLSGGIDSALIARYASELRPDLEAFTVRMPAAEFDESDAAALTARSLGVRHEVLDCDPHPAEDLIALVGQLGLPFGDSSLLAATWVSRAARSHVKVALGGEGGDEMFLGYERHRAAPWLVRASRLPPDSLRDFAEAFDGPASPKSRRAKLARFFDAAANRGYKDLVAIFPTALASRLLPETESTWTHYGSIPRGPGWKTSEVLTLIRRFDLMFSLPLDLLRKADTASMSVALELRSPFLDSRIADAAINASRASLMPRGQRKGLLRQVASRYFPPEIINRPKQGFAIPIGDWFRTDYGGMKTLLLDHLNSTEPWGSPSLGIDLNMKFVRQMLDEHMNQKRDHSQRLYMLLVLSIWARSLDG